MMLNSISVSRVQPLATPFPILKHAYLLCTLDSVLTAFLSIQTNQKPYSLAHINGFELSLPHPLSTIHISDTVVELSDQITSLGVVMDSNPTFNAHITALCKACHFHLRSLRHIWRSLTDDMAILIAVALVQSRLDYCNSLFFNMSCFNINKLQRVQNLAARLAPNDWRSPTQQILVKSHWLPIQSRIKFKICTLTYKLLSVNQPANLRALLTSYVPPRLLRSSDQCLLTQPRTRACIGQRAFSVCAPSVWNSLPLSIRLSPTLATFKRNLKTF